MSDQPAIFIGSSAEALPYAEALQSVLDREMFPTVWTYGVFTPSANTLESLLQRAATTDFAALFLAADDESVIRGDYLKTPRDNLIRAGRVHRCTRAATGVLARAAHWSRVAERPPRDHADRVSNGSA